jgi:hypothetical protein
MKNFWIFIAFISFYILDTSILKAQSDTLKLYQIYNSFSNTEKAEWTAFENNWNYFEFNSIKNTYNIKQLSCKKCNSIYADIYIKINTEGLLSNIKFINGKKCGEICNDSLFIKQFETSFEKQKFNVLKNKQFIARFGHILKC